MKMGVAGWMGGITVLPTTDTKWAKVNKCVPISMKFGVQIRISELSYDENSKCCRFKMVFFFWRLGHVSLLFRLDALALSVIATATWLAGWLGGWLSVTASIVRGWENWRFLCDFRHSSPFISETVRDRPMVTMER